MASPLTPLPRQKEITRCLLATRYGLSAFPLVTSFWNQDDRPLRRTLVLKEYYSALTML